jgi:L-Ala-D/L-Glu epimerase
LQINARVETWPYSRPFRISGYTWTEAQVAVVDIHHGGQVGRGESLGVYYKGERAPALVDQIRGAVQQALGEHPESLSRGYLLEALPPGGARNALDCALWDLEAKLAGVPVARLAGMTQTRPLLTTYTLGAESPEEVMKSAASLSTAKALKLKLTGEPEDAERVRLVRRARPDVWIGVDANQGFTPDSLDNLLSTLVSAGVQLIEQPFPVGSEGRLDGLKCPIDIAADESVCDIPDLAAVAGRVRVINIKLDKCGGLTRAFALAAEARRQGFKLMVGNMGGTSLAMAPAFVLGQVCDLMDLDGPTVLAADRVPSCQYEEGSLYCSDAVWGR